VLCGTIRRAGERIRVSAQLLEVETGTTLWADKFNENFTDVLELEDLVAEKTAKLLVPKLTGEERKKLAKRGTDNPQAFEAYLRGRYHLNLFTPEEFDKAKSYFEQAIALDAEYALAYAGLADYYFGVGTSDPRRRSNALRRRARWRNALWKSTTRSARRMRFSVTLISRI
jgi:hypothetical protein